MFTTYRSSSIPPYIATGSRRALHWSYVEQDWNMHWFYVQIGCSGDDEPCQRSFLITTLSDLEQLVAAQGKRYWLEQVQLVTPGHLNHLGRWMMEPLIEVSVVRDDRDGSIGHVFRVEGDRCYSLHPSFGKQDLEITAVLFSASQHLQP